MKRWEFFYNLQSRQLVWLPPHTPQRSYVAALVSVVQLPKQSILFRVTLFTGHSPAQSLGSINSHDPPNISKLKKSATKDHIQKNCCPGKSQVFTDKYQFINNTEIIRYLICAGFIFPCKWQRFTKLKDIGKSRGKLVKQFYGYQAVYKSDVKFANLRKA